MFIISQVLSAYIILLIASTVIGWIVQLGILNGTKSWVISFQKLVGALVNPVTGLLKHFLPFLIQGTFDLSPFVLLGILYGVQIWILPFLSALV